jgi:hypothetical protein
MLELLSQELLDQEDLEQDPVYTDLKKRLVKRRETIEEYIGPLKIEIRRHTWRTGPWYNINSATKHRFEIRATDTRTEKRVLFARTKKFEDFFEIYTNSVLRLKEEYTD